MVGVGEEGENQIRGDREGYDLSYQSDQLPVGSWHLRNGGWVGLDATGGRGAGESSLVSPTKFVVGSSPSLIYGDASRGLDDLLHPPWHLATRKKLTFLPTAGDKTHILCARLSSGDILSQCAIIPV